MSSPYYAEGLQYDKRSGEDDPRDTEYEPWWDAADRAWKERDDDSYC